MLDVNPTQRSKLARSVQRDYLEDAANHRLAKESGYRPAGSMMVVIVLTLTIAVAAAMVLGPYLI